MRAGFRRGRLERPLPPHGLTSDDDIVCAAFGERAVARLQSSRVFVGRSAALASLATALAAARGGQPSFVLVEGAPGAGKTSLIGRFLETLRGERVVRVFAADAESLLPYGVAGQLLNALGDSEALAPQVDVTVAGGRLLAALGSSDEAKVVVVDDAQWADTPSLHAIRFAIRRLDVDRVAVLACSRPTGEAFDVLLRAVTSFDGTHIRLGGLSVQDLMDLGVATDHALTAPSARRLHEHTGGLPLHVVALLEELDPAALQRVSGPLPAPRSLSAVILARVAGASRDTELLLAAAAVLGERTSVVHASAVAGLDDPLAALDEAVSLGLLDHHRTRFGDEIVFVHALVRAAVLNALAPARRSALHLRAATAIGGPEGLDHRAAAAIVPDRQLAAELRRLGQDEVDRGAIELGAHHLLESARLALSDTEARARRLDALEALVWGGALAAAKDLASEMRGELEKIDDEPRTLYLRGFLALLDGQWSSTEALLLTAWKRCDPKRDGALASLIAGRLAQLFQIFVSAPRSGDALEWAERSFALAPSDGTRPRAPSAILLVSLVLGGRPDEARRRALQEEDTRAAIAVGAFDEILGRGIAKLATDDLEGARVDLGLAGTPTAVHTPYLQTRLWSLGFLAVVEYRAGNWDDSLANAELAVSLAEDTDNLWLLGFLHSVASFARTGRGEWDAASAHVEAARAATALVNNTTGMAFVSGAAGRLALARRDPAGAVEASEELSRLDPARGAHEPGIFDWMPMRIEALVEVGRIEEAATLADLAEDIADKRGRHSAIVAVARARGALEAARNRDDLARRAFERGVAALDELRMPFSDARLRLAYGTYLRQQGERRGASSQLSRALEIFSALGAHPFAERAETEIVALGLRPRRRGVAAPTLTAREHAVARLVGEGLTNREIANRLIVSVKTVEYHLGNAFTKLGVRSRAQLAARMAKSDPD